MKGDPTTATHEAAHAVAAVVLNLPLWFVNVTGADDRLGETMLTARWREADMSKLALYHLADAVAHKRLSTSQAWPDRAARDLRNAQLILEAASAAHTWDEHVLMAEALVLVHWKSIERVAAELTWKGELVATRVKAIMEKR